MGTLRDQLAAKVPGLKEAAEQIQSEKDFAEQEQALRDMGHAYKAATDISQLDSCTTVQQFRELAKQLLLDEPSLVRKALKKAQVLRHLTGGPWLIKRLHTIRDAFDRSEENLEQVIRRALRRANPKI